jgi:hypothetical protein
MSQSYKYKIYFIFTFILFLNIAFWLKSHTQRVIWPNVPAAPSEMGIRASFLDDRAFAYRVWALAMQNFGSVGGEMQPLKNYNFNNIASWLFLLDRLDSHSNLMPILAAYYFGATQEPTPDKIRPLISYLEMVGKRPEREKWRWLVQAVYLARHRLNDMPEAYRLAQELAKVYRPGMPAWTLNMKALIAADMGDKETAYALMLEILRDSSGALDPVEIRFMMEYTCENILTKEQAKTNPLCEGFR